MYKLQLLMGGGVLKRVIIIAIMRTKGGGEWRGKGVHVLPDASTRRHAFFSMKDDVTDRLR